MVKKLTEKEAAKIIGVTEKQLKEGREKGNAPKHEIVEGCAIYEKRDVKSWLAKAVEEYKKQKKSGE